MREIELTQSQVTLVDDEDFEKLNKHKWFAHWNAATRSFYAARHGIPHEVIIRMARAIMNCPDDKQVDHKDHNTLDNQKHNLRVCTINENIWNCRPRRECASEYKGVFWRKERCVWIASIGLRNIFDVPYKQYLGYFKIEEEAALAYDNAAKEHFGEFAHLNFPLGVING